MLPEPGHWGRRIFLALVLVALATAARAWPLQALGVGHIWLSFYPAVIIAALYGGWWSGMLSTLLSCLILRFLWPVLTVPSPMVTAHDYLGMAIFAAFCLLIITLLHIQQQAQRRALQAQKAAEAAALAEQQHAQFMQTLVDAVPNMIGYWRRDLIFGFANPAYLHWHGVAPHDIIGTLVRDLMGEALFALNEPHIRRALAGEAQFFQRSLQKPDGSTGHILANYIPHFDANGEVQGLVVHASDVTELKKAHAQLELAASVFENTDEGIAVTDARGRFLSVNPAFSVITGYSAQEALGQTPRILKSNRHDQAFYSAIWQNLATHGQWKGDIWNRRKDGELYLERITISRIRAAQAQDIRYVSVFRDITDLWRKDEYLKHLAFHDALTDLPNRALLMELLQHQIASAQRDQCGLAVMFLDLDRFKLVNDSYGHEWGDQLLKVVGQRLLSLLRQSDTVARLGGDEFVIRLDQPTSRDEIAQIASRAIRAINEPIEFQNKTLSVGASIGIALYPGDGQSPDELLKHADAAMYVAKAAGKNTYHFFSAD